MKIAVVGATGLVGGVMLKCWKKVGISFLINYGKYSVASEKSVGKEIHSQYALQGGQRSRGHRKET
jgi:aspartate-semialdehyde dehydrogenase